MKALVVGLGSIGRRHARNWAALGLGEVLVCREHSNPQPEPLGVETTTFDSLDTALAAGPDVVLVTNPTSRHVATARCAVEAGAHVWVEKPLGASLEGVADLLAHADAQHRLIGVGYHLRFHPGLARLRELLHRGDIGRPLFARAEMGEYLPDWHPWEDYRRGYAARRDLGGGVVLTLSHDLDALCWVLGRPTCVLGLAQQSGALELDVEDQAEIVLRFANGALGSVHVDMLRRPPRRCLEVTGDEGVLRWEYEQNRLLHYAPAARAWRVEQGAARFSDRNALYLAELAAFARACRAPDCASHAPDVTHNPPPEGVVEPLASGRQGAAVLAIALAALRASAEGRAIDLTAEPEPVAAWLNAL